MGKFMDIWDSGKDGKNAQRRSFFRYAIVATAVFAVMVGFLNHNNIVRWIKAGAEIRSQQRQIEKLQGEIDEMDAQIRGLRGNRDSLERYARENFHFAEPGDDVYLTD